MTRRTLFKSLFGGMLAAWGVKRAKAAPLQYKCKYMPPACGYWETLLLAADELIVIEHDDCCDVLAMSCREPGHVRHFRARGRTRDEACRTVWMLAEPYLSNSAN